MRKQLLFGMVFALLLSGIACAGMFSDLTSGNFAGSYNNTFYNSTISAITLNGSIAANSTTWYNVTNATEMAGNDAGLVAYWRFNESSYSGVFGEVKDVLGKYNGTAKTG
ncbi:MAG: hypothetical protein MUF61_02400, partial [archaeon]|nr:hypothetical protein [archaeon]